MIRPRPIRACFHYRPPPQRRRAAARAPFLTSTSRRAWVNRAGSKAITTAVSVGSWRFPAVRHPTLERLLSWAVIRRSPTVPPARRFGLLLRPVRLANRRLSQWRSQLEVLGLFRRSVVEAHALAVTVTNHRRHRKTRLASSAWFSWWWQRLPFAPAPRGRSARRQAPALPRRARRCPWGCREAESDDLAKRLQLLKGGYACSSASSACSSLGSVRRLARGSGEFSPAGSLPLQATGCRLENGRPEPCSIPGRRIVRGGGGAGRRRPESPQPRPA